MLRSRPHINAKLREKARARRTAQRLGGQASDAREREGKGVRLPYMPGLDGLRALAVIAVLLYHGGMVWLPGGFLGVEVFFVLSGYLITALLVAEYRHTGRIDLKTFWIRRARRLLPALYLLVVVCLVFAVLFMPGEVARLRYDALSAFGYVTNWYLIFEQQSYFEAIGRPSLLKHLWSLAVEEQFYILWPPVLALGFALGARNWRLRRLMFVALAGAAASALLMAALYSPGADPSRIYFGTDTRATGLLLGCALALVWSPGARASSATKRSSRLESLRRDGFRGRLRRKLGWMTPLLLDIAGLAALAGLVWSSLRIGEFDSSLYQGGFSLVALSTAALIAVIANPRSRVGNGVLGWGPLRWVGERSYGIYLWHWPIYAVTRPQLDVPLDGLPLLALRLSATLVLAELSYRYVEMPIRRGALERAWRTYRGTRGLPGRELRIRWTAAAVPVLILSVVLSVAIVQARPPEPPSYLATKQIHISDGGDAAGSGEGNQAATESGTGPAAQPEPPPQEGREKAQAQGTAADDKAAKDGATGDERPAAGAGDTAGGGPQRVSAIGDSVMLGSATSLQRRVDELSVMDAEVGMQVAAAIEILRSHRATGQLGDVVVVHLGNNGTFTDRQFNQMMRVLSDVDEVVFVNVSVPRAWEGPNNEVISAGVRRYPNTTLVDWKAASAGHPEYFVSDGVHLQPPGQRTYANLIAEQI